MCLIPSQLIIYCNPLLTVRLFVCTQVASREGYLTKVGKVRKVGPLYLLFFIFVILFYYR